MRAIVAWWFRPAAWWQFWRPQSGLLGGALYGGLIAGAIVAAVGVCHAQQPSAPQKPPFQVQIEQQLGSETVQRIMLGAQVEEARAIIAQRDKTIAELQAQIAELKKESPK